MIGIPSTKSGARLSSASAQDTAVLSTCGAGGAGGAAPSLDDTFALLVEAAREACALRLRFGSQMPWGASKKAALHEVAVSSSTYKQHEKNWVKLVKAERIHLMTRSLDGCFYLPDFLLSKNGDDWTVNREAVVTFVEKGTTAQ